MSLEIDYNLNDKLKYGYYSLPYNPEVVTNYIQNYLDSITITPIERKRFLKEVNTKINNERIANGENTQQQEIDWKAIIIFAILVLLILSLFL